VVYALLSIFARRGKILGRYHCQIMFYCEQKKKKKAPYLPTFSFFISSLCLSLLLTIYIYRIYLGYHTPFQVLVGSLVGIATGVIWFIFSEAFLRPLFPYLESLPIAKYFYVRDTAEIGNVMRFEYENVLAWKKANGKASSQASKNKKGK
jgi:membrane-associated phospholipid phosphatase